MTRKPHENPTRNFLLVVQPEFSTFDRVEANKHIPGNKQHTRINQKL